MWVDYTDEILTLNTERGRRKTKNTEIAQELFISLGTVKSHLSSLQDKIGARNRVELAAFAWQTARMRDERTN